MSPNLLAEVLAPHGLSLPDLRAPKNTPKINAARLDLIRACMAHGLDAYAIAKLLGRETYNVRRMGRIHGIEIPYRERRALGVMGRSLADRIAAMLPNDQQAKKEPVRLHLVRDRSQGVHERRRSSCARLYACEAEWIREKGAAQAKCPKDCPDFLARH